MSHSGLLSKLKSICVGGSVLSICREFLYNRRQRVVGDGATSEWTQIVYGVPQVSVWVLIFSFFICEMFELVENRLYAYDDDSTLMTVFTTQQTDLLLLPPLTVNWQGFRSSATTARTEDYYI